MGGTADLLLGETTRPRPEQLWPQAEEERSGPAGGGASPEPPWELVETLRERLMRSAPDLFESARRDEEGRRELTRWVETRLLAEHGLRQASERRRLAEAITDELADYGPLAPLMRDPTVNDVLVNGPKAVFVERLGQLERTTVRFRDAAHLETLIHRIVAPLGRRIDRSQPFVDARLPDGSRVNAVIAPLALGGPYLTIRKFSREPLTPARLVELGTWSEAVSRWLAVAVRSRCNLLVSGGTGSGKTTTLNALASFIPDGRERLITVEDDAELLLQQEHVVRLEARPANVEGRGEVTIRDLVRNALRMRPDRIIIGELRGAEAFDWLTALNTGHDGALSTLHANSSSDALERVANMVLMAGTDLPYGAILQQVGAGLDLVLHQARLGDGSRRVIEVSAVETGAGRPQIRPVWRWNHLTRHFDLQPGELPARLLEKAARAGERWPAGEPLERRAQVA
ncbi:MAG: CpaF family protein [Bacillota bacterium]|nr:CpaF family protein [Bacillota bacterium]